MDRARAVHCARRSRRCVGCGIARVLSHLAEGLQSDLSQWTGNLHRRVQWALSDLFVVRMLSVQRSRPTLPGQHKGPDRDREGQEGDRCGPPHWMRPELRRKALRLERIPIQKNRNALWIPCIAAFSAANRRPAQIKSGYSPDMWCQSAPGTLFFRLPARGALIPPEDHHSLLR